MTENILIGLRVVPLVFIIVLGAVLEKTRFIDEDAVKGMKKIVLNLSLPSLIFLNFLRSDLKPESLLLSAFIFGACMIGLGVGFLFKKLQRSSNQFYPSVYSSFVTGLLGYPFFISVFGSDHLYKLAILDIGNLLFIFTVLSMFLDSVRCGQTGNNRIKFSDHIKNMAKSPIMIGLLFGILISLTGIGGNVESHPITSSFISALTMISSTTVPIILLVIGYELHFDIKQFVEPISAVIMRILLMLFLAYLLNTYVVERLFKLDEMYKMAVYTMFVLPPTFVIPVFIEGECEEKRFVLNFFSIHVIISVITFMILLMLVR